MCQRLNTGECNNFYFGIFICIGPLNVPVFAVVAFFCSCFFYTFAIIYSYHRRLHSCLLGHINYHHH